MPLRPPPDRIPRLKQIARKILYGGQVDAEEVWLLAVHWAAVEYERAHELGIATQADHRLAHRLLAAPAGGDAAAVDIADETLRWASTLPTRPALTGDWWLTGLLARTAIAWGHPDRGRWIRRAHAAGKLTVALGVASLLHLVVHFDGTTHALAIGAAGMLALGSSTAMLAWARRPLQHPVPPQD